MDPITINAFFDELIKIASETATKTDPEKWERAKRDAVERMGGKHSARAMQLAVNLYKDRGGDYAGNKPSAENNSMRKWTKQEWQTRPGTPERAERSDGSTSRYLPKEKWESLSKKEQIATDRKKLRANEQYVDNTRAAKVRADADYIEKQAQPLFKAFNTFGKSVANAGARAMTSNVGRAASQTAANMANNPLMPMLTNGGSPEAVAAGLALGTGAKLLQGAKNMSKLTKNIPKLPKLFTTSNATPLQQLNTYNKIQGVKRGLGTAIEVGSDALGL
jgi:hypothetical protein